MKRALLILTLAASLFALSAHAGSDPIEDYANGLSQVEGHAGRGASAKEVKDAERELAWIQANEAHLRRYNDWLKSSGRLIQPQ